MSFSSNYSYWSLTIIRWLIEPAFLLSQLNFSSEYYRIGGNFRQEKIFAYFATCSRWWNFLSANFLSHRGYGDLYRIGKNLFHRKFLQYKGICAWRNFCLAKIFTFTVLANLVHYALCINDTCMLRGLWIWVCGFESSDIHMYTHNNTEC